MAYLHVICVVGYGASRAAIADITVFSFWHSFQRKGSMQTHTPQEKRKFSQWVEKYPCTFEMREKFSEMWNLGFRFYISLVSRVSYFSRPRGREREVKRREPGKEVSSSLGTIYETLIMILFLFPLG